MAKKSSKNGTIAIASGVRADCSDRLERVIDHITSEPHSNNECVRRHAFAREERCPLTTGSGEHSFGSDRR